MRDKLTILGTEHIGSSEFITHTVTAAEDTANSVAITTDFKKVEGVIAQAVTSAGLAIAGVTATVSGSVVTVAWAAAAAGDVVKVIAYGRNDA